jgi:hypothetical protein
MHRVTSLPHINRVVMAMWAVVFLGTSTPGTPDTTSTTTGCAPGRSLRLLDQPGDVAKKLFESARTSKPSPFFPTGTFDQEQFRYLGRVEATPTLFFEIAIVETTWGEACRMTRRILVFDKSGEYLGNFAGISKPPLRLEHQAILFSFLPEDGNRIDFSIGSVPPQIRIDGELHDFERATAP